MADRERERRERASKLFAETPGSCEWSAVRDTYIDFALAFTEQETDELRQQLVEKEAQVQSWIDACAVENQMRCKCTDQLSAAAEDRARLKADNLLLRATLERDQAEIATAWEALRQIDQLAVSVSPEFAAWYARNICRRIAELARGAQHE